jgi:hypothetical protein
MRKAADLKSRNAALALLARGIGSPGEIAELGGVSRQLVESWARSAGIDWRHVKRARLTKAWRHEIMGERSWLSRKKLRKDGETLKEQWDKTRGRHS